MELIALIMIYIKEYIMFLYYRYLNIYSACIIIVVILLLILIILILFDFSTNQFQFVQEYNQIRCFLSIPKAMGDHVFLNDPTPPEPGVPGVLCVSCGCVYHDKGLMMCE